MGSGENGDMSSGYAAFRTVDWDPIVSMDQSFHFPDVLDNHPICTSSELVQDPSHMWEFQNSQEVFWNSEVPFSSQSLSLSKNVEEGLPKGTLAYNPDGFRQIREKKQKTEETNGSGDLRAKKTSNEGKYVHVRAKRGQATNPHSLAERVRRERIGERMRLLQELVPGCNKIIGKAVMLDEIINYVQSLQQQVEFLSMKLATVNPEFHLGIERAMPKEASEQKQTKHHKLTAFLFQIYHASTAIPRLVQIFTTQRSDVSLLRSGHGTSSSMRSTSTPNPTPPNNPLFQNVWGNMDRNGKRVAAAYNMFFQS
ncbi:hypothetical protein DM860_006658 [Cuscuta australis]|uniref:BHLH domain-containing protein n=1 Tax=Cuscuta australis TaxID=267555 RepID=A0A328D7Y8_9ASTE|nr:hypothetical protein DM860_006658 [Cuscuta australis]